MTNASQNQLTLTVRNGTSGQTYDKRRKKVSNARKTSAQPSVQQMSQSEVNMKWVGAYFVSVIVFSIFYSIPHFFEYEISEVEDEEGGETFLRVAWTELRKSRVYTLVYTIILDFAFRVIIPALVMVFTNFR